jgi:tetratricopeptide (TPR) repeat protein
VVTGEVDMERGTHGVAGSTINLASRLCNLAKPGEILIDLDTCRQVEGHFACEYLEEATIKGKEDPVQVHKVLSQKEKPVTIHRLSGLRSELVGRKLELAELIEAVENLQNDRGRIFSICGAAGTGKSRLVEEFKATLDLDQIQWIEGHAYAYSQNIPYFPLIDLLNRILAIEENDTTETVREKVETGIENLIGKQEDVVPYVGGLYSLSYPEVENVSPEFWKSHLQSTVKAILSALADKAPTIYFLEDLHWADPSFVELLRQSCLEIREPAIVLCVYRPTFSLFTGHQLSGVGKYYHEIQLKDLSRSEAQDMLESILKTSNIPSDLRRLVQSKAEGNPFYLEELVNSLIESETLIRDNGHWEITKSISEAELSTSIHGLISGRLDRLDQETKRILQEASVIGRAFLYEILIKITELKEFIDGGLSTLERLDMIRTRTFQPNLEYIFKHALTQEVVYNGLLKKERRLIHERIGLVMEQLFQDRLPEFYEALAYQFKRGQSPIKAVSYLMKSGEKSLQRFALEESHKCYQEAFDLLASKSEKSKEEELIIEILINWAHVYYYRGDFNALVELLSSHEKLAESLDNKIKLGMFYAWRGFALLPYGNPRESYDYLARALKIGTKENDELLLGYTYAWLAWTCMDLGRLDEGIHFAEQAQEISKTVESDHYIYYKSLSAIGQINYFTGKKTKAAEVGKSLVECGERNSNIRSLTLGYVCIGIGHMIEGDFLSAEEFFKKAEYVSVEPYYSHYAKLLLAIAYIQTGKFLNAEKLLQQVFHYSEQFGSAGFGLPAKIYLSVVQIAKGKMNLGMNMIKDSLRDANKNGKKAYESAVEYILGKVYLQMVEGTENVSLTLIAKNIGFLVKALPFAAKKAEKHFFRAIEIATEIGANSIIAQTNLDLSLLYKAKKNNDQAKRCISEAIRLFEQAEASVYLKQAKEVAESLG